MNEEVEREREALRYLGELLTESSKELKESFKCATQSKMCPVTKEDYNI